MIFFFIELMVALFILTQVGIPAIFPTINYFWLFRSNVRKIQQETDRIKDLKDESALLDVKKEADKLAKELEEKGKG